MSARRVTVPTNRAALGGAWRKSAKLVTAISLLGALAACAWGDPDTKYPDVENRRQTGSAYESYWEKYGSVFGDSGSTVFGDEESANGAGAGSGSGIDVNGYLWRASLDTISFMPLASADPFGGVIITDWYSPPEAQSERFKINIFIFGRQLRADGVRAAVFRQNQNLDGSWADSEVDQQTVVDLENAILARARQLRIASLQ